MNIYDTPYFNQGNNNEEIIEQDTWRTNMNPQLNRGNYGINTLGQAPHPGLNQFAFPNPADISGEVGEYGNTSGFDLSNMDNPTDQIGPIMNFRDAPREFGEPRMNNPRVGPIDMWKNQGGDETTRRFPGILGMMQSMFQRPEAKQKEFETYQQSKGPGGWGDIGGGYQGNIWGNNKLNVYDPASEQMILRDKNFDSAFGSGSVEEMIAKKEAWARKRRAKGEEYLSTAMNAWLDELDKKKGGADGTPKGPTPSGDGGAGTPGSPTYGTKAGATATYDRPGAKGSPGYHWAQGGRVGYRKGGRVGILAAF